MKRTPIHKISFLLLFLFVFGQIQANPVRKKSEFTRTYEKSYAISNHALLILKHQFSNVEIINWNKNEVSITVDITVTAKTENRANEIFDKIIFDSDKSSNKVTVETYLKGNNNCSNSENFSIEVTIYAPATISLDSEIEFGNFTLDTVNGACNLEIQFGNVEAKKLTNTDNEISIEYGNFEVDELACKQFSVSFGNLEAEKVLFLEELDISYGNAIIDRLDEACRDVEIDISFGSLELSLPSSGNYDMNIDSSFGDVDLSRDLNLISKEKDMFSASYRVTLGSGTNQITIDSSYSDVEIDVDN